MSGPVFLDPTVEVIAAPVEEESEWDVDEEPDDEPTATRLQGERSTVPYPTEPPEGGTWGDYFKRVRSTLAAAKLKVQNEDPSLVITFEDVPEKQMSIGPRGVLKKANMLGMETRTRAVLIYHPVEYMVGDGAPRKDGTRSLQGDVKKAEWVEYRLMIAGVRRPYGIGFNAIWSDGKFASASGFDRHVGFPREAYFEYKPIKQTAADKGGNQHLQKLALQRADDLAEQWNAIYNDGVTNVFPTAHMKSATEFTAWLWDWIELLVPGSARPEPKPKKITEPEPVDMLALNEWSAA